MATIGTAGYASVSDLATLYEMAPFCRSWLLTYGWNSIEASPGVYSWTDFDSKIAAIAATGMKPAVIFFTGNYAPTWLYSPPYSVAKVTMDTGLSFPYYLDANGYSYSNTAYNIRYKAFMDECRAHLATLASYLAGNFAYVQVVWGTTGDQGPWHGSIVSVTINGVAQTAAEFDIDENGTPWTDYVHEIMAYQIPLVQSELPLTIPLVNTGINGAYWQYVQDNYPLIGRKIATLSHNYSFPTEAQTANYGRGLADEGLIVRGEIDDPPLGTSWWSQSPNQNTTALVFGMLNGGMNVFNVATLAYLNNTTANDPYEWFTEFAANTTPSLSGWLFFRDVLDIDDTARFPEGTYGAVIDPAQLATYTAAYNAVQASSKPSAQKSYNVTLLKIQYANAARIAAMNAVYPSALNALVADVTSDQYNNDFACNAYSGSWRFGITPTNERSSTNSYWRTGSTSEFFGRYALGIIDELFATVDFASARSYTAVFRIWYLDGPAGVYRLYYWNGSAKTPGGTITTTNTGVVLSATFTIYAFYGGGLMSSNDFSIKHESGSEVKFHFIALSLTQNGSTPATSVSTFVETTLEYASIAQYLADSDTKNDRLYKGTPFDGGNIGPLIRVTRAPIQRRYDVDPTDSTLTATCTYLYRLIGKYLNRAKVIAGNADGGGGTVIVGPTGSTFLTPKTISFIVGTSGMNAGDTSYVINEAVNVDGIVVLYNGVAVPPSSATTYEFNFIATFTSNTATITFSSGVSLLSFIEIHYFHVL